jgi:hypothetical protein
MQAGKTGKSYGRRLAATVKLIQWRQRVDGQRLEVLARGGKGIEDRLPQAASTPVVIDRRTLLTSPMGTSVLEPKIIDSN